MIVGRLARFAARRIVGSQKARALAAAAAKGVAQEAKTIARDEDKVRAATRSAKRLYGRAKGAVSGPKSDPS